MSAHAPDPMAEELGEIAYEAYAETHAWKHFDGRAMAEWSHLGPETRRRWRTVALAVADSLTCARCTAPLARSA